MNERRIFSFPATLNAANRKVDRSLSIRATTNLEVNNEDFALTDTFVGHAGHLYFVENGELLPADVPKEDAIDGDSKKPSVRLRGVLWHMWDQNTDRSEDFDTYYKRQMERIIESIKQRLN